ncbi:MAG: AAA family ATPase [Prevotellaceae bacterium]|jgi:DNA repair exonuclease SbcCD ATPase subunit|nr:AAA family ATPase [Prevotellaceae bacterium]
MKTVAIKQITLINFKGIKNLTVDFGPETEIRGDNATGKSTVCDAFHWVLFGKSTDGSSDTKFGIKTVDANGNVIPKLDHEVCATLDVAGETVELRRVLSEDWVTPRGKATLELRGNTTSYFVNGVPLKEGEYKTKVNEIISEDLFRMITSPLYFPRLDWQAQREMLLRIAGGVTLEEIAANRADFSALLARLSGKDLSEFKAEISARKKKIKEELEQIPARIDEVTRATPEAPDYQALEAEKKRLSTLLEETEAAIASKAEAARQQYEAAHEAQKKINDLRTQQQSLLFEANKAAQKEAYEKNAQRNEAQNKHIAKEREEDAYNATTNREIRELKDSIFENSAQIARLTQQRAKKVAEWDEKNSEAYEESTEGLICPIYKVLCSDASVLHLDANAKEKAKTAFYENKRKEIERIITEGNAIKSQIADATEAGLQLQAQLTERTEAIRVKRLEYFHTVQQLCNEVAAIPEVELKEIAGADLPEWVALQEQIGTLSEALKSQPQDEDGAALTAKKREIAAQLDAIKAQLSTKKIIEDNNARKAALLERERDLAQQKADLENEEFTAAALVKEQMSEVERRVNKLFTIVRVKMFSQQLNGGEKPDCILMGLDGVKFLDTNSANKIAMGLDIINALCEFHKVTAPIFVDNAEGINRLLPVSSQIIKLIVTYDKQLIIK